MVSGLTVWIIIFVFFANTNSHILSWASSFESFQERSNISNSSRINKIEIVKKKQGEKNNEKPQKFSSHDKVFLERYANDFKTKWCRIHQAKLDWKKYLAPCAGHTKWGIEHAGWSNKKLKTSAANSFISKWDIRPAGEFSRFFIQSKTSSNYSKNIGGDSWRIHIKGTSSVSATIFDHNNGSYEVIFLLMEAGLYQIEINLDYTLCDGFKDPPADWYKKGIILCSTAFLSSITQICH